MFNDERYLAINEEVEKLLATNFIEELEYPKYVSIVVIVKKSNEKRLICIDYKYLNKAYPNDGFPC